MRAIASFRVSWLLGALALALGAASCSRLALASPGDAFEFVERTTAGASAHESLPMIVAIHGLGDRPEAFVHVLDELPIKARVIAPRAPDPWHEGTSWYPVDDPARKPGIIRERAARLATFLDALTKRRPTLGKPIVLGFSQGGVMSFALAAYHPAHIRAALPIAGALPEGMPKPVSASPGPRVIALHGRDDARVKLADAERTVKLLSAAERDVTLATYPDVGHHISAKMQRDLLLSLRELLTP